MSGNVKDKSSGWFDLSSEFWRIILLIIVVLLVFVGPTYVPYLLAHHFKLNYEASVGFGFALFVIGLVLMWYFIRKKIIE